jgi:hypothetical protein
MVRRRLLWRAVCGCILPFAFALSADALQLISEQEASLPDDNTQTRGISRGPKVVLINPAPTAGLVRSPFGLKIRFESFAGAKIDTDTVVITYKKKPAIDLTQRAKSFVHPDGIEPERTEVPAGEHRIRVDVKDSEGRAGWTEFTLKVAD